MAARSGYHQNDSSAWIGASSSRSSGTKGRSTRRSVVSVGIPGCCHGRRSLACSRHQLKRQPGSIGQARGRDPDGRWARRAAAGRKDRTARSPARPPTTSTHSSPVSPFLTCATNSHVAPRRRVPSTCTGSPGLSPAHRVVRRRSATASERGGGGRGSGAGATADATGGHEHRDSFYRLARMVRCVSTPVLS